MRKLSVEDILKGNENCYSFVVAIAKRARQISEKANDEGKILDEKPVQLAVKEFVEGKFRIAPEGSQAQKANPEAKEAIEEKTTDDKPANSAE